jgi:hypothetical protein
MPNRSKSLVLLAFLAGLSACATTTPAGRPTARRRHRNRTAQLAQPATAVTPPFPARPPDRRSDAGSMDARTVPASSFGSPVLAHGGDAGALTAQWSPTEGRPRIRCEGTGPSVVPSTQSPYEPVSAMIVRSFLPSERGVLACRPPTDVRGRLPVHGLFGSNGAPVEYSFAPGVSRATAMCLGAALCGVRMPAFRAPNATVDYEFLVAVAHDG